MQAFSKISTSVAFLAAGYELPIAEQTLIDANLGFGGAQKIDWDGEALTYEISDFAPFVRVGLRQYYNLDKRKRKGKKMDGNAGNFIGLQYRFQNDSYTDDFLYNDIHSISVHWGLQRDLGNRFLFNFHVGMGYFIDKFKDLETASFDVLACFAYRF